ncbi:MAG: hypothetical protein Q7U04_10060 [Bacteriovorax sp.]|nr:hypothetical protein [Bacteriovorax sp.]
MNLLLAIRLVQIIISFAVLIQTIEYLLIKESFSESGVWRWKEIQVELHFLPSWAQAVFNFFLNEHNFPILLWIRLSCALLVIFFPAGSLFLFLFFSSLLIAQRFRGSFNGGSDYMSLIILMALSIQGLFPTLLITKGVLWYIALQSATSYFMAGLVKLKLNSWRTGSALGDFIQSPNYNPPIWIKWFAQHQTFNFSASWLIMIFEISFPLILIQQHLVVSVWLLVAFAFHFLNVFVFGLNRFLIVWLASYPAIYFCAFENIFSNSP